MNTGVSGATALSSARVGRRFSANWCSVKPPTTRTHCGAGVRSTCALSMAIASASVATPSQRSSMLKFSPPLMMCMWLSIRPGINRRPPASISAAPGAAARTSASLPTARMCPSRIATASACGLARSSVVTSALWMMRSSVIGAVLGDAARRCAGRSESAAVPASPESAPRRVALMAGAAGRRMQAPRRVAVPSPARRSWSSRKKRPPAHARSVSPGAQPVRPATCRAIRSARSREGRAIACRAGCRSRRQAARCQVRQGRVSWAGGLPGRPTGGRGQ